MKPDMATRAAQSREIRAALDRGDNPAAESLMKKYGLLEQAPDLGADDAAADAPPSGDVLLAAILQAESEGDTATADRLKALAAPPPA